MLDFLVIAAGVSRDLDSDTLTPLFSAAVFESLFCGFPYHLGMVAYSLSLVQSV